MRSIQGLNAGLRMTRTTRERMWVALGAASGPLLTATKEKGASDIELQRTRFYQQPESFVKQPELCPPRLYAKVLSLSASECDCI